MIGSHERFKKGVAYMLLSSVLLSLFTLFSKFATGDVSYFLLVFLRFGVPFVLLLPYLLWTTPIRDLLTTGHIKLQLLRVGSILLYQYSIFYYLTESTLLNATVLQNTAPLFIPLFERLFFRQQVSLRVLISILVSFIGVLCLLQPDKGIWATLSVAAILSPLGQAGSQVFYAHQSRRENQKVSLFYLFFLSAAVSAVIYFFFETSAFKADSIGKLPPFAWVSVLCLGVVSIFNQSFRGIAYQHASPSALTPFLYVSLIFSAVLDWAFFDYFPNALSIVGACFVVAGGMIQIYTRRA